MSSVYPEAPVVKPAPPPFDEGKCVEKIVELRAAVKEMTKVTVAGRLIHVVGGTVDDIYRVWDEVEKERVVMDAVSPADHTTLTKYKGALGGTHLNATTWYDAMLAKHQVGTYAALRTACTPAVTQEL